MRPSGRKASRQGSSKLATVVMVKGWLASGFCSPALTCAQTAACVRVSSNAAFDNFIFISPCFSLLFQAPGLKRSSAAPACRAVNIIRLRRNFTTAPRCSLSITETFLGYSWAQDKKGCLALSIHIHDIDGRRQAFHSGRLDSDPAIKVVTIPGKIEGPGNNRSIGAHGCEVDGHFKSLVE